MALTSSRENSPGNSRYLLRRLGPPLEIRNADFKGCALPPLLLLLFEKPSAAGQDPEITFANSFRGSLEMCTNRRPFQTTKGQNFFTFHVVSSDSPWPAYTAYFLAYYHDMAYYIYIYCILLCILFDTFCMNLQFI